LVSYIYLNILRCPKTCSAADTATGCKIFYGQPARIRNTDRTTKDKRNFKMANDITDAVFFRLYSGSVFQASLFVGSSKQNNTYHAMSVI